jgi:NAD(P)-dependent dehydrogenase (short-subunit alcohol dehydrogenase family)
MTNQRVALVTGASSGIGRETACELARQGTRVMAVARRADRLADLTAETGIAHLVGDLSTEAGCRAAVEGTAERLGPVDVLVHAAGAGSSREREVWRSDPEVWRETMAVNLDAAFHLMRFAAAGMVDRGWGRVVVVSSTAGLVGGKSEPAYDASKHGVIGLVRASAIDLAPHSVTCNAVLPGWVRTEMAERSAGAIATARGLTVEQVWKERAASYSAGRIPTAEEVARTIAFLCSEGASGISGEAVTVALGDRW